MVADGAKLWFESYWEVMNGLHVGEPFGIIAFAIKSAAFTF